jgi:hypothetical protein
MVALNKSMHAAERCMRGDGRKQHAESKKKKKKKKKKVIEAANNKQFKGPVRLSESCCLDYYRFKSLSFSLQKCSNTASSCL